MFHQSDKPQVFTSKEKPVRKVLIEFDRREHFNALIDEKWCPLHIRLEVAKEQACKKQIIVLCETDEEAVKTAQYHFYSTGSNFKIQPSDGKF